MRKTVLSRFLNALTHAPTETGLEVIAMDIITASEQPHGLKALADFYKVGLLLPSKPPSVRNLLYILINMARQSEGWWADTTPVLLHPCRDPGVVYEADAIAVDLELAKRDGQTLKKYEICEDTRLIVPS